MCFIKCLIIFRVESQNLPQRKCLMLGVRTAFICWLILNTGNFQGENMEFDCETNNWCSSQEELPWELGALPKCRGQDVAKFCCAYHYHDTTILSLRNNKCLFSSFFSPVKFIFPCPCNFPVGLCISGFSLKSIHPFQQVSVTVYVFGHCIHSLLCFCIVWGLQFPCLLLFFVIKSEIMLIHFSVWHVTVPVSSEVFIFAELLHATEWFT